MIFTANNAFNEAVAIIASLIGQDKSEINLQKLGIKIPELKKIRETFENQNFSTIRDKLIAHKDKDIKNDPTEHIFQLVLPEKVQQLSKIKDELNEIVYKYFKHPFDKNNPFVEPLKGLHEILDMF